MSASERIPVVPAVLEWARRTAGLQPALAAKRLGISETALGQWERGEVQPTIKQLRRAAKLYGRPLAVLLLPVPPKDFQPLKDFRLTGAEPAQEWSPALHAEFKRALSQREVILELAEIAPASLHEATEPLVFNRSIPPEDAAQLIRSRLGIEDRRQVQWSNPREALGLCIGAVEQLGTLVVQTQDVPISEMRGFSVSDWPHPVIALNGSDWPRPRLFTLLHEMCHVALNVGGLCDLHEARGRRRSSDDELEHYCNQVAASVLMPRDALLAEPSIRSADEHYAWSLEELAELSRRYGASSEALLLRLVGLGKASWDLYWRRKAELEREYEEARRKEKERQRESDGGPSYYVVKARDLGHGYVASVLDAYRSRAISSLDVADYLDVRYDQLPKLEKAVQR